MDNNEQQLKIYRSNSSEKLLALLADLLRQPNANIFTPECIVVQSSGMATWLSLTLCRSFGIWANPDFPHPRQMIKRITHTLFPVDSDNLKKFSRNRLLFALLEILPLLLDRKSFSPLKNYLTNDDSTGKIMQLAEQIAYIFDQYAVYRPQMVVNWEAGKRDELDSDNIWQAELWQEVIKQLQVKSAPCLLHKTILTLQNNELTELKHFPPRLFFFGIATLPPLYLKLFAAFARHIPLHFFILSPSAEYWGEIRSSKEINRLLADNTDNIDPVSHYFETGNRLLASLGTLGRDFQQLIEESTNYEEPAELLYNKQFTDNSMLHLLQHDMLHLINRHAKNDEHPPRILIANDHSISIHSCHSRLREIEILSDQLLELFAKKSIKPCDVIVMAPDIDIYAPFIETVFNRSLTDQNYIPYQIADRPETSCAPLIDTFLLIFELAGSRAKLSEISDLLTIESLRKRFGINSYDLAQIHRWLQESAVRWGINENHRTTHNQPKSRQNSWEFGLDRLALGYVMVSGQGLPFNNIMPYNEIEGQDAILFGALLKFCETLFDLFNLLDSAHSLGEWQQIIIKMLNDFFIDNDDESWQLQKIRNIVAELTDDGEKAGFTQPVDLTVLLSLIKKRLKAVESSRGFLSGGVTFCAMLPMRAIPFQVVAILGMNDGEFPRHHHQTSFDLIARTPFLGDRLKKNEDKYLFLEALLAARQKLLISYIGMSIKDGSSLPPAIVVDELLDWVVTSFKLPPAGNDDAAPKDKINSQTMHRQNIYHRLVVRHPLQPFSPRYFMDGISADRRLFSYEKKYCQGARLRLATPRTPALFLPEPLPTVKPLPTNISLNDLISFFRLPARWFLQNRLRLYLEKTDNIPLDREPLNLTKLDEYLIRVKLLEQEDLEDKEISLTRLRGEGILPAGSLGETYFKQIITTTIALSQAKGVISKNSDLLDNFSGHCTLTNQYIHHNMQSAWTDNPEDFKFKIKLSGELTNRCPAGLIRTTAGSLDDGRFYLSCWLTHLFLNIIKPQDQSLTTYLIGKNSKGKIESKMLMPTTDRTEILTDLVQIYLQGNNHPLLFFPKSSFKFASIIRGKRGSESQRLNNSRKQAYNIYHPATFSNMAEGDNPSLKQLFGSNNPLAANYTLYTDKTKTANFEKLAVRIFTPLLAHLTSV